MAEEAVSSVSYEDLALIEEEFEDVDTEISERKLLEEISVYLY